MRYTSSPPPAIACDDVDGTVVVTTSSSANYDVFDPRSDRFTSYPLPAGTGANSVAVSSTGEIAVGLTELSPTPPGIDQADEVLLVDGIGGATRVVKVQRSLPVLSYGPNFLVGGAQTIAPGASEASPGPFGNAPMELPHRPFVERLPLGDGRVVQVEGEWSVWVRGLATPHPTPTVPVCPTPLGPFCPITGNIDPTRDGIRCGQSRRCPLPHGASRAGASRRPARAAALKIVASESGARGRAPRRCARLWPLADTQPDRCFGM